jgi:hypothetical protein
VTAAGRDPDAPPGGSTDGPQPSRDVDLEEFLRILPFLESAELLAISATYADADEEARIAARTSASAVAKQRGLMDDLGRLQGSIIQWAGAVISESAAITFDSVRPDQVLGDLRRQAMPPLLDAGTALLLRDALPAEHRATLLEPFAAVID